MSSLQLLKRLQIDSAQIRLSWLLIIPFVLLTTGTTTLVGYLSYRSGQQATENLANQLLQQTSERVGDRLTDSLQPSLHAVTANQFAAQQDLLDLNNREQVRQRLWEQINVNPSLSGSGFWDTDGTALIYTRAISREQQQKLKQQELKQQPPGTIRLHRIQSGDRRSDRVGAQSSPETQVYPFPDQFQRDFRQQDWYRQAIALDRQSWTAIFAARIIPGLQIMAVVPAEDGTGQRQGVFAAPYLLSDFSQLLNQLRFSPTGQIFIIERSGNLVATSFQPEASATRQVNGKIDRLPATESQNAQTRQVAQQLLQQFGSFQNIHSTESLRLTLQAERQFVQITPYQNSSGLDWLVVTVIHESDFMTVIQAQHRWTLLLCGATLLTTTALGLLLTRCITKPLDRLNLAADKIARNELDQEVPISGVGQVKQLSLAFQKMAEQLRFSFQLRLDYERELEQQVRERTTELAQVRDLREAIFNESTDAIFLVEPPPSRRILDCNQRAVELFEAERKADLIGIQGATLQKQPFTEAELTEIAAELAEKGFWSLELEYITRTGKSFWGNLAAKPISVAGQAMQLVRLTDISDRKHVENERKQLEFALQQSEAKTTDILNSVVAAIASLRVFADGSWVIDRVSAGCELICGYTAEALTQDRHLWFSLIDAADFEAIAPQIFANIFAGKRDTYEYRLRHKDGRLRWISQTNNPVWDEVQQCWNLTAISVEITERKQIEEQLRRTEQWLQQFSRQAPTSIYTFVQELDGRLWLEYTSAAIEAIQEITPAQAQENVHLFLDQMHPEDRTGYAAAVGRSAATLGVFCHEWRITTPSGKRKWLQANSQPERRSNGAIAWYGIIQDITVRKQTEESLRESEERFRQAFDNAAIGMALVAIDGQFLKVNRSLCEMLGYSETELLKLTFQEITDPIDLDRNLELRRQMLIGERRTYQMEKRYFHKRGGIVWVLLCVSLVRNALNQPLYFVSQMQDISDRHKLDEMKDEFISIVSHELRTPLTSIRGSLGILDMGVLEDDPETAQRMLKVALRNSDRLVRLVNDILDLERLESGKTLLFKETCQVNELIEQAIEAVQTIAHQAEILLHWTSISLSIKADPDAIVQTLTNLLSNAIKFSPAGSTVYLRAELQGSRVGEDERMGSGGDGETGRSGNGNGKIRQWSSAEVEQCRSAADQAADQAAHKASPPHPLTPSPPPSLRFSVSDQGRGIPPEKLESIFGRFQQVDSSDARQRGGTGLGLAICKSIVQQHQGSIWVESIVGQGSTFYFTLPVVAVSDRQARQ